MTPPNRPATEEIAWACITVDGKAPAGNPDLGFGISCHGMMESYRRIKETLDKIAEEKDSRMEKCIETLRLYANEANWSNGGFQGHPNDFFTPRGAECRAWIPACEAIRGYEEKNKFDNNIKKN